MSIRAGAALSTAIALSAWLGAAAFADVAPPPKQPEAPANEPAPTPEVPADNVTPPPGDASQPMTPEELAMKARAEAANALVKREGVIALPGGQATVTLADGFAYLDQADTEKLLTKVWGNPPGAMGQVIGAIVPRDIGMLEEHSWAAVLSYTSDGHVADSDAASIDYDELLKDMQKGVAEANEQRVKQGYDSMKLIGWAQKPSYNAAEHKLYWAKHIRFGESDEMLNYAIRALGRTGVLEVNIIADMKELAAINQQMPKLLSMVSFTNGHRYADFKAESDPVAAYGLAALVAGGVAAKAGLLKWLIAAVLASWKLIAAGVVIVGGALFRLFGRRKGDDAPPAA